MAHSKNKRVKQDTQSLLRGYLTYYIKDNSNSSLLFQVGRTFFSKFIYKESNALAQQLKTLDLSETPYEDKRENDLHRIQTLLKALNKYNPKLESTLSIDLWNACVTYASKLLGTDYYEFRDFIKNKAQELHLAEKWSIYLNKASSIFSETSRDRLAETIEQDLAELREKSQYPYKSNAKLRGMILASRVNKKLGKSPHPQAYSAAQTEYYEACKSGKSQTMYRDQGTVITESQSIINYRKKLKTKQMLALIGRIKTELNKKSCEMETHKTPIQVQSSLSSRT